MHQADRADILSPPARVIRSVEHDISHGVHPLQAIATGFHPYGASQYRNRVRRWPGSGVDHDYPPELIRFSTSSAMYSTNPSILSLVSSTRPWISVSMMLSRDGAFAMIVLSVVSVSLRAAP